MRTDAKSFTKETERKVKGTVNNMEQNSENNPRKYLFSKLTALIDLTDKKIYNHHVNDKDKRAWARIIISAVAAYGNILKNDELEAKVVGLENKILYLITWGEKDDAETTEKIVESLSPEERELVGKYHNLWNSKRYEVKKK